MIADSAGNLYFADTYNNCVRKISNGAITTYAGKCGSGGYSGDGKPAVGAQLSEPAGLAFDSFGNLYIGDSGNRVVREVSTVGTISTVVGPAQFAAPSNLAMDASANLYISDSAANRVFQYSLKTSVLSNYAGTGAVTGAYAGDGGAAAKARLNYPAGLAVDPSGNLYIADSGNYRLREVLPTPLTISTVAGNGFFRFAGDGGLAIDAQLNSPTGTALDSAGNLYFADTDNNVIRKVTPSGNISTVVGNGLAGSSGDGGNPLNASLNAPMDVALDSNGNLYIADAGNAVIRQVVLPSGPITTIAGGGSATQDGVPAITAELLGPVAVAIDANLNIYIAEENFGKVAIVTHKDGKINTFAGQSSGFAGYSGDGGPAFGATLNSPEGLAFDGAGNLYIADTGNNVIRKVTPGATPTISTVAGNRTATSGPDGIAATASGVNEPHAVAVDSSGNLYIAEFTKIREVGSGGLIQTIAGGGPPNTLGDGGSPTAASLGAPEGLQVDGAGNVLIADTGNGRIRKVIGNVSSGPPPPGAPPPPTYQLSASSLTFAQSATGAIVPPQTLNLTPTANGATAAVNGLQFSVAIATDADPNGWLSLNLTAGSMPASLVVTASPGTLAPGKHTGTITISAPGTANPTASVPVTFTIPQPPLPTAIPGVDTQGVTFTAAANSGPLTNQFHVLNTGGELLPLPPRLLRRAARG
jgi:sugar lactone lactonase YvrE/predicted secreted protein